MPSHPAARLPTIDTLPAIPALPPTLRSVEHAVPAADEAATQPRFELFEHLGGNRATVEAFISQCFAESFGSRIEAFMPRLFSVRNEAGDLCGAFGLRSASRNLFLEQYLDAPIEKSLRHAPANASSAMSSSRSAISPERFRARPAP
nr:thermostable hemolysin [Thiobacillus sp.]